jgi:L-iditol 2-dehydrogenase
MALALVEAGRVDVHPMVTARFGLEKVAEALESNGTSGNIKAVIEMDDR